MDQPTASLAQVDLDPTEPGPFSSWAFAALLLGVLSTAALAGPILWFIPVVTVVISLIAMRQIQASDRRLSGWYLALFGLLLAVFFGMAGPARTLSRHYYLEKRAARFAEKFMKLLQQNQPALAFQLMCPAGTRKPIAVDEADPFAKDPEASKAYGEFLKSPAVKFVLVAGLQANAELLSSTFAGGDELRDEVAVEYRVAPAAADADHKPAILLMQVERTLAFSSHTEQWQIIPQALRIIPQ